MGESLTQPNRVQEDGRKIVNCFSIRGIFRTRSDLTVGYEQAPANSVPAAAVIRRVQALSGFTRFKGSVGCILSQW